jgi:2-polyprenyl-3-methyl-5-hydroxy-6-metoxy-1,4-benzoquinol methylase
MNTHKSDKDRQASFGTYRLSMVDHFGIWLSRRVITKQIVGLNKLSVLELGCGYSARNLLAIEDRALKLVGVDFNLSEAVKSHPKISPLECSAEEAIERLRGQKFDLIMIISVLEHLHNPVEVLQSCRELLKPGGILLVNVPTWLGKVFLEYSAFNLGLSPKDEMDDHKMYYDKRDLWPILVKSGFLPSNIKMNYHKLYLNLFASVRENKL